MSVGRPVEGGSVSTELLYSHTHIHNIYIPCTATDTPLTLLPLPPCPAPFTVYIGAFLETGRPSVGSVLAPSRSLVWFLRRLCVVARICLDLEGSQSLPNFGLCTIQLSTKIFIKKVYSCCCSVLPKSMFRKFTVAKPNYAVLPKSIFRKFMVVAKFWSTMVCNLAKTKIPKVLICCQILDFETVIVDKIQILWAYLLTRSKFLKFSIVFKIMQSYLNLDLKSSQLMPKFLFQ